MQYLAIASLLVSLVSGVAIDLAARDSPLSVAIEVVGNSEVKATVTNNGGEALKLLKAGSILDSQAVEKTEITTSDSKVQFDGLRLTIATHGLPDDAFVTIAAGGTLSAQFDVAAVHDLGAGGAFSITSTGAFSYAAEGSNDISGAVPFSSNTVTATVDGAAAAVVRRDFHARLLQKRTAVQSDCTGTRRTATTNAVSACRSLAAQASSAAASGSAAKMTEYFKSSTSSTRSTVAQVFARVASECGSTTGGNSRLYCSDVLSACSSGVLAYTQPSTSIMVNCPLYYSALPALSRTCHAQDQATTTLHEATHLRQVAGTDDFGVYGYAAVQRLSAAQNLRHADTYTLFAQSIYAGC
ncbi:hypothetical protein RB601_004198 [Gaeumannomyces tritici]